MINVLAVSTIVAMLQKPTFVPLIAITAVCAHSFMPELPLAFR